MKTLDEIMERLMRLDRHGTSIRMRDSFPPGPNRWYVRMDNVMTTPLEDGGYYMEEGNGSSPEDAAQDLWDEVTGPHTSEFFFVRCDRKPGEDVPGSAPQVWVRWDDEKDDWKDIVPTQAHLNLRGVSASDIRPYKEQSYIDRR